MLKKTFESLVDPIDKSPLTLITSKESKNHILTGNLKNYKGNFYPIDNGVANLIPEREKLPLNRNSLNIWEKLQDQGNELYKKFPQFNLSTSNRDDVKQFSNFSKFTGTVLDVGCGPVIPNYLINNNIDFGVGIDPLVSSISEQTSNKIDLLRAIGEILPFKNKSFDFVCFCTSFDHVLEPTKVLIETQRVLKKKGNLVLWIDGEPKKDRLSTRVIRKTKRILKKTEEKNQINPDKNMLLIQEQQKLIESMEIPSGAVDHFHLRHIHFKELDDECTSLNFKLIGEHYLSNNQSLFVKYQLD